jgi:hypothetical protein
VTEVPGFDPDYRPPGYWGWTREEKLAYTNDYVRSFCASISHAYGEIGRGAAEKLWNHWFNESGYE